MKKRPFRPKTDVVRNVFSTPGSGRPETDDFRRLSRFSGIAPLIARGIAMPHSHTRPRGPPDSELRLRVRLPAHHTHLTRKVVVKSAITQDTSHNSHARTNSLCFYRLRCSHHTHHMTAHRNERPHISAHNESLALTWPGPADASYCPALTPRTRASRPTPRVSPILDGSPPRRLHASTASRLDRFTPRRLHASRSSS